MKFLSNRIRPNCYYKFGKGAVIKIIKKCNYAKNIWIADVFNLDGTLMFSLLPFYDTEIGEKLKSPFESR